MTSFVKYTLFCLAFVLGSPAKGDNFAAQSTCEMLILLIPEELQGFPMASCEYSEDTQVIISTTLTVPANRVVEVERVLSVSYGMEPLRFVCCGYEADPIAFPIAMGHPLANDIANGAFRSILLSVFAEAFLKNDTDKTVHALGAFDAVITIEMVDY